MSFYERIFDSLCALATEAGRNILEDKARTSSVMTKSDMSPLTSADLAAHHAIIEGLTRIAPEIPVISEESEVPPFAVRRTWERYFLIDPLDGTKEFIKGRKEYTVNIALIEQGEPVMGIVYAPELELLFAGARGMGAYRSQGKGERRAIRVAESSRPRPRIAGSTSHATPQLEGFLQHLGEHELVRFGSSLKICQVADGTTDLYPRFGPTSEWDTAAGHGVVLHAGGKLLQMDGSPLRYNQKEDILNPYFLVVGPEDHDWVKLAQMTLAQ